ncbi:hypothetical protein FJW07_23405 [Mesorhizobium sp. B3-1-9]|uniref:hypothetical protein n=1 Tax=Mesorhizobium sp. B3-1-9 TaxID=2589892 RepID=UPI0011273D5A|nr:hypothetical protein [Mesorhizobium sp. B3-1-9]TPI35413.1 hypothetical protein FJW07_23405 [Mesorhizobium sp. B3-1-9]
MNASGPKERATFSIDSAVKETLENQVPKNKRSRFVEEAIAKALKDAAKERALKMIRELKPGSTGGESLTDVLRRIRQEMDGRPEDILEGRKK